MESRQVLKTKLHGLSVTQKELYYSGSIVLPRELCDQAGLRQYDVVEIYNFNSGARYTTYVLYGGPGEVQVKGPSARLCEVGDRIVLVQYVQTQGEIEPTLLFLNSRNESVSEKECFAELGA